MINALLSLFGSKSADITMLNWHGETVSKPADFKPTPSLNYTIEPAQKIPYSLWGEVLRAEINATISNRRSGVNDVVLVKKSYLKTNVISDNNTDTPAI